MSLDEPSMASAAIIFSVSRRADENVSALLSLPGDMAFLAEWIAE